RCAQWAELPILGHKLIQDRIAPHLLFLGKNTDFMCIFSFGTGDIVVSQDSVFGVLALLGWWVIRIDLPMIGCIGPRDVVILLVVRLGGAAAHARITDLILRIFEIRTYVICDTPLTGSVSTGDYLFRIGILRIGGSVFG